MSRLQAFWVLRVNRASIFGARGFRVFEVSGFLRGV